ncbi:MAG: glycosyl transferase family 1 [Sulfurimonas sp.]|nr:MAG: glycosyl transferase family 1 [Sulfurimonas sp.]
MKIAIIHDWLVTDAGAEKVLKSILELYPDADIFSLVDFLNEKDRKEILNNRYVNTSFIQNLPFAKKHFRNYLPLFPRAIQSLDLKKYYLLISSSWAVAKGIRKNKNQLHISYCYTPIRYAWDLYDEYTSKLKQPKKFLVKKSLKYIRKFDLDTVNSVDYFIADSNFVALRIKKTYNRDSIVIYPPVDVDNFSLYKKKEEFYLTASRLVPYKKTKLIVEAFNEMPNKKLYVIGDGDEYENIKKIKKDNIFLLGYSDTKTLISYMQKAKAFIYAAVEDFGIVPIEANACGTPVIALNQGGTKETIEDGINGIHFEKQSKEDIINAVEKLENTKFNYEYISKATSNYSIVRFKKEIKSFIDTKVELK